ncbi:MAG: histidine kinase [Bacteroidota bacterium]|nr:histidine kinase [Bacteroidota bacterium]
MRRQLQLFIFLLTPSFSFAQNADGLVARYYFNDADTRNDVGEPAKPVGVSYSEDRFGRPRSACNFHGNSHSYLNLGTSAVLKPTSGSISLWMKLRTEIAAGSGAEWNPIIVTKSGPGDDFYESYSIVYSLGSNKISAGCTLSEMEQLGVYSREQIMIERWYHLVLTYDDKSVCFYVDGVLQDCLAKTFRSTFMASDSVVVGNSANQKNNRFFAGSIDDISIYNKVLSQEEITDLYEENDPTRFYPLLAGIMITVATIAIIVVFLTRRFKRELAKEKEKNKVRSQMSEMEMKVIKAQMNPHFIFNAMNSIQQFILADDTKNANTYLVKFSRLLRKILESNTDEYITVDNEIDILTKYIEIESLRFQHAFSYEIIKDERCSGSTTRIPQMMIQPFIENAIWHGLLPKKTDKKLVITFECISERLLSCTVDDNGVGRFFSKPSESIAKKKSFGIQFTEQRLDLMKKEWGSECSVKITDKTDAEGKSTGTQVIILIPIIQA